MKYNEPQKVMAAFLWIVFRMALQRFATIMTVQILVSEEAAIKAEEQKEQLLSLGANDFVYKSITPTIAEIRVRNARKQI